MHEWINYLLTFIRHQCIECSLVQNNTKLIIIERHLRNENNFLSKCQQQRTCRASIDDHFMFGRRFSFCFFICLITLSDRSIFVIFSMPVSYKSLLNVELPQPITRTSSRGLIYLQRTLAKSIKSEYLNRKMKWNMSMNNEPFESFTADFIKKLIPIIRTAKFIRGFR